LAEFGQKSRFRLADNCQHDETHLKFNRWLGKQGRRKCKIKHVKTCSNMFNASNLGAARRCQSPDRDARQRESEEKIKLFGKIFLLFQREKFASAA